MNLPMKQGDGGRCTSRQNPPRAKNAPRDAGDVGTWTAICADTKLYVGDRTLASAREFLDDLKERLSCRIQLTSDGHRPYVQAVDEVFGREIDYGILQKIYGPSPEGQRRYSPPVCMGARRELVKGSPDPKYVSTSYAERHNLTMRMHMRRFTRLTNGFSKKIENHACAVALHCMYYNFVRIHKTLKVTPAMAAGVTDRLWEIGDIVAVVEAFEQPRKRAA